MSNIKTKEAGDFLRSKRKELGFSLFKVARNVGITGNYLSLIERGERIPSNHVLSKLADYYEIDPENIYGLYNRVYNLALAEALTIPSLKEIIAIMSINTDLTPMQKEDISKQLLNMVKYAIKEEKHSK